MTSAQDVLDFWFDPLTKPNWFSKSIEFDQKCLVDFGAASELALTEALDHWCNEAEGARALIILLDQIPRNIHRGRPEAFRGDAKSCQITKEQIKLGRHQGLSMEEALFLYLPLEHSEHLEDQNLSVQLFEELGEEMPLDFAIQHQKIIERFGRFPHRNEILGRASTEEELAFLKEPGSSF